VFGAVLARERRSQLGAALLTLVFAGLFDLLFLTLSELPATVPVALAMIALEARRWRSGESVPPWRWRPGWARAPVDAAQWGSSPVDAGGRDSSASDVIAS
jgi:hypothetical protein